MRRLAPFAAFVLLMVVIYPLLTAQESTRRNSSPDRFLKMIAVGDRFARTESDDGYVLRVGTTEDLHELLSLTPEEAAEYRKLRDEAPPGNVGVGLRPGETQEEATARIKEQNDRHRRRIELRRKELASRLFKVVAVGENCIGYREGERTIYLPERRIASIEGVTPMPE